VKHAHEELGGRLAALRADFAALGTRAAGAAEALTATLPPPTALLDELTAAHTAFAGLRSDLVEHAGELSLVLDTETLGTLRDLEPVLAAIGAAEERRVRLAAWQEAREDVLGVLDRVMALIHREEKGFPALAEAQQRARELHGTLADAVPDDLEHETKLLPGRVRPYAELLALVEGWNALDDDRCAFLQDAITQAFSRPLGLAALRGKLGREGELPPAPLITRVAIPMMPVGPAAAASGAAAAPPAAAPTSDVPMEPAAIAPAAAPVHSSAVPVAAPPPEAPAPPAVPVPYTPTAPPAPPPGPYVPAAPPAPSADAGGPTVVVTGAGSPGGPRPAGVAGGPGGAPPGSSLVVEIRLSGDKVSVETPEARREREELLERLAQESARWWIAARDGWHGLRERGFGLADAARDYLKRFPYLLSVPLQKSADHADGRLAEGYALLLAHIEKQEEGFVKEALTRLNPQFSTRAKDQSYPLGQELYLYVVAEGRLYKTYPDFVREVILHTVPEPGPWVQGGIVESDGETRIFMRPAAPGSRGEETRALTDPKERLGPHVFSVTLAPLTTRFFTLKLAANSLQEPPDVEIKLRNNDAPSDHAWIVTLPAPGKAPSLAPRKHRTGGTTLAELGKEFSGLWLGVFNADPSNDHHYELDISLRRKLPAAPPPTTKTPPTTSKFFGRSR
jgi:hypothetical protein